MGLVALKCPHCGADIELDEKRESGYCSYCGTKIINDNVKTLRIDNSAQLNGVLSGAYNSLRANDLDAAEKLIDEALKQNGSCSDALYLKSAIMVRKDFAKAASYYRLAEESQLSVGVVSVEQYTRLLIDYLEILKKDSLRYVVNTLARNDYSSKDMDNCRTFVTNNKFNRISRDFPYFDGVVKGTTRKEFEEIEEIMNVPDEITQEHWDKLRYFDDRLMLKATVLLFTDGSLESRYKALLKSYVDGLNNKWVGLFRKGPVAVDHKELTAMKYRANLFVKWIG